MLAIKIGFCQLLWKLSRNRIRLEYQPHWYTHQIRTQHRGTFWYNYFNASSSSWWLSWLHSVLQVVKGEGRRGRVGRLFGQTEAGDQKCRWREAAICCILFQFCKIMISSIKMGLKVAQIQTFLEPMVNRRIASRFWPQFEGAQTVLANTHYTFY